MKQPLLQNGTQKEDGDNGEQNQAEPQIARAHLRRRTSFLWMVHLLFRYRGKDGTRPLPPLSSAPPPSAYACICLPLSRAPAGERRLKTHYSTVGGFSNV